MIKLNNVSKFYYNKGVIATGFNKVNLEFDIGEFVAITGESGSGKSTLLNVLSGLDSYEEGEMYINGEETSHYSEKDFEIYRRKYVGNIFQSFNLVNSYTVYQNIELVLLLNGEKRKDIKKKAIELIKKVDLYKYRNSKVSKLSGGQKQRVAIARALAKETPIIIADEPTGNLDSKSAETVIETLHKISKEKLVIIVTHNYEQVEKYATRKVTMSDGKVIEDKKIKQVEKQEEVQVSKIKDIRNISKLRLGIRNTFNIVPKFLLLFAVYIFMTVALLAEYSSYKNSKYISENSGYNIFFQDISNNRVIIKKKDNTVFTEEDYSKIKQIDNVKYTVKDDLLCEYIVDATHEKVGDVFGYLKDIEILDTELVSGRMPQNENEVVVALTGVMSIASNELLDSDLTLSHVINRGMGDGSSAYSDINKENDKLKVVGISMITGKYDYYNYNIIYATKEGIEKIGKNVRADYIQSKVTIGDFYDESPTIIQNNKVPEGKAFISSTYSEETGIDKIIGQKLEIEAQCIYYKDKKSLEISQLYDKKNIENVLGVRFNENEGYYSIDGMSSGSQMTAIFINPKDYDGLYNKGNYQSSVYVEDKMQIDETCKILNDNGIATLEIKDTLVNTESKIIMIFTTVLNVLLVIGLFFIAYFILRVIMKSRNVYFSTIRILGASKKVAKNLLMIEFMTITNIAYFVVLALLELAKKEIIKGSVVNYILGLAKFITFSDYIALYCILIVMSYIVSTRFSKKLFKNSSMQTYREEV